MLRFRADNLSVGAVGAATAGDERAGDVEPFSFRPQPATTNREPLRAA
jgi:hypothetical protein